MLSYHEKNDPSTPWAYRQGFRSVEITELRRVATCMSRYVWSPCVWRGGVRHQENFMGARLCVLDFDSGEMTLADALNDFCDMRCIIGTTKSHQIAKGNEQPCDRFRVVFLWEEAIMDLRHYRYNMAEIMRNYPVDKSCKDGARYFFPCREIVHVSDDGYYQEVLKSVPKEFENFKRPSPNYGLLGIVPQNFINKFERNYKPGAMNTSVYGFAKDCAKVGLSANEIIATLLKTRAIEVYGMLDEERFLNAVRNGVKAAASPNVVAENKT